MNESKYSKNLSPVEIERIFQVTTAVISGEINLIEETKKAAFSDLNQFKVDLNKYGFKKFICPTENEIGNSDIYYNDDFSNIVVEIPIRVDEDGSNDEFILVIKIYRNESDSEFVISYCYW